MLSTFFMMCLLIQGAPTTLAPHRSLQPLFLIALQTQAGGVVEYVEAAVQLDIQTPVGACRDVVGVSQCDLVTNSRVIPGYHVKANEAILHYTPACVNLF